MRTGHVTLIEVQPNIHAAMNDIYVVNVPMLQFTYAHTQPRPSIEQLAVLAGTIQQAIDSAIAQFEMHWRRVAVEKTQ